MTIEEIAEHAAKTLGELLSFLGYNAAVETRAYNHTVELSVDVRDGAILIGHGGETLAALQYLVNVMTKQSLDAEHVYIVVDISGYKQAKAERLAKKVQEWAKTVVETGEDYTLPPMSAAERRVVHMALADTPEVVTESTGERRERRVVIKKA